MGRIEIGGTPFSKEQRTHKKYSNVDILSNEETIRMSREELEKAEDLLSELMATGDPSSGVYLSKKTVYDKRITLGRKRLENLLKIREEMLEE